MAVGLISVGSASAAITHEYLPTPSQELTKGASAVFGMAADSGELYVVETHGLTGNRLARFSVSSGALVSQFPEVPALSYYLGVAVAHSSGEVYLAADDGGSTGSIAVFDSAGALQKIWQGADTASGGFGCFGCAANNEHDVAVDNSSNVETRGDVYVASPQKKVVDVIKPGAGGSEETIPVHEITGISPTEPFNLPTAVAVDESNGDVLVVDGRVVDVFKPAEVLGEYEFVRQITGTPSGVFPKAITDIATGGGAGNGDVYVAVQEGAVYQFSSEGVLLDRLTGISRSEPFNEPNDVAVDPSSGEVLVEDNGSAVDAFGPNIVIPDVATATATEVHATHVQLGGTVKLDEAGPAACSFEYGTTTKYGSSVPCEPTEVKESEEVPAGTPVPVKATIGLPPQEKLQPDTTYYYRLSALNGNSAHFASTGNSAQDEGEVSTSGPGLHGESASEVASTAASLDATIDPRGSPTSYYFQYNATGTAVCDTKPTDCTSIPVTPEAIGSAASDVDVSQRIQGLKPSETYHYRVLVLSEPEPGRTEVFPEPDQTFTTQPAASSFTLPDGRQWELVSPPDKHGASIASITDGANSEGWVTESAASGGAMTYLASNPTEANVPGYATSEQVLSTRTSPGWESQDIPTPHSVPIEDNPNLGMEYRFFSEDLSLALTEPLEGFTSLRPFVSPPDSELTPYLRHNLTCSSSPGTCFQPLATGAPGFADVPEGTTFGRKPSHNYTGSEGVTFVGASPDLTHVAITSQVALKAGGQATAGGLYEFSTAAPVGEEQLQLASVLPASEGGGPTGGEVAGPGAVSGDGSRVVWSSNTTGGLYLTDMTDHRSVRLGTGAAFERANREASRILFTNSQPLIAGAGVADLYECEVTLQASGPACVLRDVAPGAALLSTVFGFGSGEHGSYVYFVSNGVVGDGAQRGAPPGNCTVETISSEPFAVQSCNLYMSRYDSTSKGWDPPVFIGALSREDNPDWRPRVAYQTTRVSPNGEWLTFMSSRSLTGYDNHDAHSGKPDEEVFLYNGATQKLLCASCNPTGARPDGLDVGKPQQRSISVDDWGHAWLAANIPPWTLFSGNHAAYQSRFLSNSGRLFFNSSDALVPQDVNNQEDVYQWEPAGAGGCSSSAPGFSSSTGGCVGLISSGTSPDESAFLDASENGDDVFFLSAETLVPADTDTAYDVYDAHVCGAEGVPCAPPAASPPPCANTDACRAAPTAQPEVFGAPPSATFSGPGNLAPLQPAAHKPKTAAQIRAEKLAKALKTCRKDKKDKKRAACERTAREKYGATKKAKKSTHHQGAK